MDYLLREVSVSVARQDVDFKSVIATKLNIDKSEIMAHTLMRKSVDGRKKNDIRYKYTFRLSLSDKTGKALLADKKIELPTAKSLDPVVFGQDKLDGKVVVVGAGPCGLFATHTLLKMGYPVLLIERGKPIEQRRKDVDALHSKGKLDANSNVCFGEGGAGTFSDGKLTTRTKDLRAKSVLETFVRCGAKADILYEAKPHLGTDGMQAMIKKIRAEIIDLGGEVVFEAKLTDVKIKDGQIIGVTYHKDASDTTIDTNAVVMATGHSAKDTFRMLHASDVFLEKKATAVGLRVEHRRSFIDDCQHADFKKYLGAAEYALTAKHNGRGVYSFCMCPGGTIVCSASDEGHLCTNGMSDSDRAGENSNAAVVVNVKTDDVPDHPLAMLDFIDGIEKKAYIDGFIAPTQQVKDYINGNVSKRMGGITPSYPIGTQMMDLNTLLPDFINESLKAGLEIFDRRIRGFIKNGLFTGVETRTSSPVRITRDKDFQSTNIKGLFPAGEGAGYAGGIVSAAVDGIKVAEKVAERFSK
jgi:uncharacterized protein